MSRMNAQRQGAPSISRAVERSSRESGPTFIVPAVRTQVANVTLQRSLGNEAPEWVPDEQAPFCMGCGENFTFFKRRHHCRGCGKVFCGDCSSQSILMGHQNNRMARACKMCFDKILKVPNELHLQIERRTRGIAVIQCSK